MANVASLEAAREYLSRRAPVYLIVGDNAYALYGGALVTCPCMASICGDGTGFPNLPNDNLALAESEWGLVDWATMSQPEAAMCRRIVAALGAL